ncbi:flagellar basal body L-ring protein FlgH [Niveibacterium sp. COAC-50]|uniref:flagellar basal body L-ring protein FlgH n=1 Tax=Niveibacterium sp. COAC-50 TaxID=2729384 RepID=UPI0015578CAF|nr:flagellar basal body L-ring protein FlgH [Niveibacterium sp. COAC-50]
MNAMSRLIVIATLAASAAHAQSVSLLAPTEFRSLTADRRAWRVGDVLTIAIQENATATTAVDLGTHRRSAANVNVDPIQGASVSAGAGLDNDSTGAGRMQRSGRLLAQITVAVTEILPSGDLAVAGEQQLDLNGEAQTIRVRGRLRSTDIDERNVVQSNRLADARIQFVGDGFLTDAGKPGLLSRLLTLFGL